MRQRKYPVFFLIVMFALIYGCSGGGNPITPSQDDYADRIADLQQESTTGTLGIYNVHIDIPSLTGELSPVREVSSQDVLEVIEITSFLTALPCVDCVRIKSIELDTDGNLVLNIGIRHPFEPGDTQYPPSGKNRLDLHLFNIEGIAAIDSGSYAEFSGLDTIVDKKTLLNASGYTGYLDNALDMILPTTATIHPYILHFVDYTTGNFEPENPNGFTDIKNPSGYHVMKMGSEEDVRAYVFNLDGDESLDFIYAIGATYGISSDLPSQRLDPVYRLPQFNKKAASEVQVRIVENNLLPGITSSSVTLEVDVLDMNYDAEVGDSINQIRAESKITKITVLIQGIGSVVSTNPMPISGAPTDPDNPLKFQYKILNSLSGMEGIYSGIVKVTDSYPAGLNENVVLNGNDGVSKAPPGQNPLSHMFSIDEFATYQYFEVEIATNLPPVADLDTSNYEIESGDIIDLFPGSDCHDPDGEIVLYEYDFRYDGINFVSEVSNATGDPVYSTPYFNFTSNPIIYQFAMRVTDDGIPVKTSIDVIEITVNPYSTNGWGVTWGDNYNDLGLSVYVNERDGVYVAGSFSGSVDFDPSDGIAERTATGISDCFLSKFDFDGNFLWVNTWGSEHDSPDGDAAYGVAADVFGWVYVTGVYYGLTDFDPGAGSEEHQPNGNGDIFISRFDENGDFDSVHVFGGDGIDVVNGIAVDGMGEVFICGGFEGAVDFNPGAGTDEHTASGFMDAYVTMYDSNFEYQWTRSWGTSLARAYSVDIDSSVNIYTTGFFMDTVDFDPGAGTDEHTSNGAGDVFLTQFNRDGEYKWTRTWGSAGDSYWQRDVGYDVAVDFHDNVHVTGSFNGTVDFDGTPGTDERTALGSSDAFLCSYTSHGNYIRTLTWGSEDDEIYHGDAGISVVGDIFGNVLVTGGFYSTVDFDPGPGTFELTSNGSFDSYLIKIDSAGEFVWARSWGGTGSDDGLSVSVDEYGSSWVTGYFAETIDLNPGNEIDERTSNGYLDVFLSKFRSDGDW